MCADPRTDVATAACCLDQGTSQKAWQNDTHWGERIKYSSAAERCAERKLTDDRFDMCTSSGNFQILYGFMPYQSALRKNMIATADLAGRGLTFRVPVQFMSVVEPTERDALYETDAVIDHLLYHENTAPFVALHYAQQFGTSNPSPHYTQTIAEAF